MPSPDILWSRRVGSTNIELTPDRWGYLLNVVRGSSNRLISLNEEEAAAVRDGLTVLLGERK